MSLRPASRTRTLQRGFTLLELIVVITIIGLLGTLVVTKVAPILFQANRTKISADLQKIVETAKIWKTMYKDWPRDIGEMVAGTEASNNVGLLEEEPKDPWSEPYQFDVRDDQPIAWCLGKNKTESSSDKGDDEDVYYPPQDSTSRN
jgi:general secretion pathway protein G